MANHFPTEPINYHVQAIAYQVFTQPQTPVGFSGAEVIFFDGTPWFAFGFDTGTDSSGNPTYNYGSFDQDSTESSLIQLVQNSLSLAGVSSDIASYTLMRYWVLESNTASSTTFSPDVQNPREPYAQVITWAEIVSGSYI